MFHGQVPLLGIGQPVGIEGTVHDVLAVIEGGINKWGPLTARNCREPLTEDESRRVSAIAAAEWDRSIKPILAHPSTPTRVDRV